VTTRFEFVPRIAFGRQPWDEFVDLSDDAWLWHRFDFQDVISTWPGRRDLSFAILDTAEKGECVCLVPLQLSANRLAGLLPWTSLESLGGLAYLAGLAEGRRKKLIDATSAFLVTLARRNGAAEITLAIAPLTPSLRGESLPRVNPLLTLGCENSLTQTWLVDLRTEEERLWARLEGRARTEIRKAERAGVVVRNADQLGDLDAYYELHRATCVRTGINPHPREYFEASWQSLVATQLAHVLLAERDGVVVAAANFAVYKKGALYWTGAAAETGLEFGANALLQWRAIQWMLTQGVEWYETGEAFPNLKEGKLKQLSDFKKSFGGALYPYYRGRLVVKPRVSAFLQFARALLRSGRRL